MKPEWVLQDRTPEVREMQAEVEAADGQRRALQARYDRLIGRWREARDLADRRLVEIETLRAEVDALSLAFDVLARRPIPTEQKRLADFAPGGES